MTDLEPAPSIALVNAVLGVAALVASVTGFGYALVAIPFLVLLLPPAKAVPLVLISWFPIAIFLVVATVVAAVFTSHQLGIMRKAIYQLESAAGELRRQLEDMETEKRQAAGRIRALRRLREQKMMELEGLYAELKALTSDDPKQVGVSAGLAPRAMEPAAA